MTVFTYLAALFGILQKVWRSPDRLKALRNLTPAERFVLQVAGQLLAWLALKAFGIL